MVTAVILYGCTTVFPETYPYLLAPDNYSSKNYMGIRLLDSVGLRLKTSTGEDIAELSGLAWDEDEQLLYAVSDEGILHHLQLTIKDEQIKGVRVVKSIALKNKKGKPYSGKKSDSEGLTVINSRNGIRDDSRLFISFEGKPRVIQFSPSGEHLGKVKLPEKLKDKHNYRGRNKALESITFHPAKGLLTAAEYPLRERGMKEQVLYAVNGQEYHFRAAEAKKSAVTGLTTLPNGNILVLERAWAGIQNPIVISLREVEINDCNTSQECPVRDLAIISSAEGWYTDNFEGVTHFQGNRFFMVSDDNESSLQSTVLVFFEVLTN